MAFHIDPDLFDEDYGERDEEKVEEYLDELMDQFAASPEGKPLMDSGAGIHYAPMMIEYSLNYLGVPPARMSLRDFNEVVFDIIPRKVSTEAENAPAMVDELKAFWQFMHRQFNLANAGKIAATLNPAAADRLQKKLADPANWGMAKSMFMMGQEAGFDMTTQEGLDAFMLAYNSRLLGGGLLPPLPPLPPLDERDFLMLPLPGSGLSPKARADKRKARKRQRQARKRNRK